MDELDYMCMDDMGSQMRLGIAQRVHYLFNSVAQL